MNARFVFVLLAVIATACDAQWVRTNGPTSKRLSSLVADTSGHLYAACDSLWFRSSNDCQNWEQIPRTTYDWNGGIFCVGRDNILFGGSYLGISRSTNLGNSWTNAALYDYVVSALHAGTDGTVYAGVVARVPADGWYVSVDRSTNNGLSWTTCSPAWHPSSLEAITTTPQGTIFAAEISHVNFSGTIVRSSDSGVHWDTVNFCPYENVMELAVGPDGSIFAGTVNMMGGKGRALRSTDNGQTWASLETGSTGNGFYAFAFPRPGLVVLGTLGVYASTDNGDTWIPSAAGLPTTQILALAVCGNSLIAATDGAGIWKIPLSEITDVESPESARPRQVALAQNYPNPFNPTTSIRFELPASLDVRLSIFDILGREVSVLVNERWDAGVHEVTFDGSALATGVYFCRLQTPGLVATRRLLLLK
jgi:hypothetical protein